MYDVRNTSKKMLKHCFRFHTLRVMPFLLRVRPHNQKKVRSLGTCLVARAVASLTVPGGQEFHFPHLFPQIAINFSLFFLKLNLFSSSFWLSGWASRPPGKALATPLLVATHELLHLHQHQSSHEDYLVDGTGALRDDVIYCLLVCSAVAGWTLG